MSWTAMAPSPTAEATRLTDRWRTSPAANTPGRLVSRNSGGRAAGHCGTCPSSAGRSRPVRTRWRADLPGAVLTLALWIGGSVALRLALSASTGSTSIYGPLAAPIAVLLWLYLLSIAVLIGAAFNAAVDSVWPRLSGIEHDQTAAAPDPVDDVAVEAEPRPRPRRFPFVPPRARSASRSMDTSPRK